MSKRSGDGVLRHPSTKRAKQVDSKPPFDKLVSLLETQDKNTKERQNVLHWFRGGDLRAEDNKALSAASRMAQDSSGSLLACYIHCPKDLQWHGIGPARAGLLQRTVAKLRKQLAGLDIPLVVCTADERADQIPHLVKLVKDYNVSHVFANFEYEIDELRRDVRAVKELGELGVHIEMLHDQTAVAPLAIANRAGNPHKVFTPYYEEWIAYTGANPDCFDDAGMPEKNSRRPDEDLFHERPMDLPSDLEFDSDDTTNRIQKLWPAGHEAAIERLHSFMDKDIGDYFNYRSAPDEDVSSRLSPYFATGTLSVREALRAAKAKNGGKKFATSDTGINAWVRELVFREFYRQLMVITPHISMNLPRNLKFDFVQWETDEEGWQKWCNGTTGMPFIDAGMRQLKAEAFMHNRLRMNVASYLRTNLLIDYRRGERYFAENLIDFDLCNNSAGWEPSYTVFNPVTQAEKNDPKGEYIRRWVPELRGVEGKAVFDPYNRLSREEFEKLGYPTPHVDWHETKARCIERYKRGLAEADP